MNVSSSCAQCVNHILADAIVSEPANRLVSAIRYKRDLQLNLSTLDYFGHDNQRER